MGGGIVGAVDDFNEESLYRLPGIVDKLNILKDNEFTDFATGVFIKIRNLMGIPTEEYLLSTGFTQFIGNIMLGKNTSYTVSTSAGKSGSLFFTTADSRYLIKTIPAREALSVQRILPNYFKVFSHPFFPFHFLLFSVPLGDLPVIWGPPLVFSHLSPTSLGAPITFSCATRDPFLILVLPFF